MSKELIEQVLQIFRSFALREAEEALPDATEYTRPFLESVVASRGGTIARRWKVTDSAGVVREFKLPSGEPDLAALDTCSACQMEFQSASVGHGAKIDISAYSQESGVSAPYVIIESSESSIDELLAATKHVFTEHEVPAPEDERPPFKVFIGHGGDPQWKYLQRALTNDHNIRAEAFESSERVGYHTLVVVDQMVRSSSAAVIVMTGEDTMPDGSLRSRENVIHEIGFCQGALGINRTIVVMEEGISEPSNITGLTQIRFPRGRLIDVEDRIVEAIIQRQLAHDYANAR